MLKLDTQNAYLPGLALSCPRSQFIFSLHGGSLQKFIMSRSLRSHKLLKDVTKPHSASICLLEVSCDAACAPTKFLLLPLFCLEILFILSTKPLK